MRFSMTCPFWKVGARFRLAHSLSHIFRRSTQVVFSPIIYIRMHRLFNECKESKILFGFPIDIDPNSEELLKSRRFIMHASYLIQMIDTALNMLGPDIELLTEIMTELGQKHVKHGVKPEYFPKMGIALIETLAELLGDSWTEAVKEAWIETYDALSGDMIEAQLAMNKK